MLVQVNFTSCFLFGSGSTYACMSACARSFKSNVDTCYAYAITFVTMSCCSICHSDADPFGDHHAECGSNDDRGFYHDSTRDALFSAAQSATLAPRKEVPSLISSHQSHPADIYLPHWLRGLYEVIMIFRSADPKLHFGCT